MQLKVTLPVAPSVNKYLGMKVAFIGGRHIAQSYETKVAKEYKMFVKTILHREIKKQNWITPDIDKYVVMDITFYLSRKRMDADNCLKVMQDAIVKGGVVGDDDIIIPRVSNIYIDKYNPRAEVIFSVADKIGLFDNEEHLNVFKRLNCEKCKKSTYKRKCGILQKALDNRIEPELNNVKNICYEKVM